MKILICTDDSYGSIQSAELVSKLNFPPETRITVLGVSESIEDLENLAVSMDQINKTLGSSYPLDRKIRNGNPIDEIMSEAIESSYDLVAVGGAGKQLDLLQPQLGSTTKRLARKLNTHFLVARNLPEKIQKILVCVGAEKQSVRTMRLGGAWISNTSAKVGLLHVLPKGKMDDRQPDNMSGQKSEDEELLHATRELFNAGLKNEIVTRIRQGAVVEEVLKEIIEGAYELLVIGAHFQPDKDHWQETLLDDVTDQLLNRSKCSVLII